MGALGGGNEHPRLPLLQTSMIPIPTALPLERCQPDRIHRNDLGQAWFGHAARIDQDTCILQEANLILSTEPREGDDLWIDGNAITMQDATPLEWPTLEELEAGMHRLQLEVSDLPEYEYCTAREAAHRALHNCRLALAAAQIAVAEVQALDARRALDARDDEPIGLSVADCNTSLVQP